MKAGNASSEIIIKDNIKGGWEVAYWCITRVKMVVEIQPELWRWYQIDCLYSYVKCVCVSAHTHFIYNICLFLVWQWLYLPVYQLCTFLFSTMKVVCKALLKTWKELYHSFARLSALVATTEANTCLEEMCAKIIQNWCPEFKVSMLQREIIYTFCFL